MSTQHDETLAPRAMLRRFDVFAEYNRLKNLKKGMPSDEAKGYALWLAKVIARRKFARTEEEKAEMQKRLGEGGEQLKAGAKHLELGGKYQTGEIFDKEIVQRMGEEFYDKVFSPAVAEAIENHQTYESIRDALRVPMNFRRAA